MKRAYSYVRFSSGKQRKGHSEECQDDKAQRWCDDHGCYLDTSLTPTDRGVSAFRGKNAAVGRLGAFLQAVESGRVERGSVLIVESLDRLSRQAVPTALKLFLGILEAGIDIVALIPTPERLSRASLDTTQLIVAIVILSRAYEESATKSSRGKDRWEKRRATMRQGRSVGRLCPKWLVPKGDGSGYDFHPEKSATVKRIWKLYQAGHGTHAIATLFNSNGVAPLGHGREWSSGQVFRYLTLRELTGERQPRVVNDDGQTVGDGPPIPDYYPALIDRGTFDWVQLRLKKACVGRTGPRGKYVTSLFTGLMVSGALMVNGRKRRGRGASVSEYVPWTIHGAAGHLTIAGPRPTQARGRTNNYHLPYRAVEKVILQHLHELQVRDLIAEGNPAHEQLERATGRLDAVRSQLAKITDAMSEAGDVVALATAARKLESEERQLAATVEALTLECRHSAEDAIEDLQDLIRRLEFSEGDDLIALRTSLKARLRDVVKRIRVELVEERHYQDRTFCFVVEFHHLPRIRQITVDFQTSRKGVQVRNAETGIIYDLEAGIGTYRWPGDYAKALATA